jgi:hypothetical protein
LAGLYDLQLLTDLSPQVAGAGILGLEVVDPAQPGYAKRAAFLLGRDGFCVIRDVLDAPRLAKLRRGCEVVIREVVGHDPGRVGNRGSHRYSFGQRRRILGGRTNGRP